MLKKLRIALLIPFMMLCLVVTATGASATSGWKYTSTSTCCRGGMDIDGPAGTNYIYDFQWSLKNIDVFGTGNNSFWVYLAGPEVVVPYSSVTVYPGGTISRVINEYRHMTQGTYCLQVWSYTYPGGYYGKACAYIS